MDVLDAICPQCRATCGLGAPRTTDVTALCDPHREYVERRAVERPVWRKIDSPWPTEEQH